MDPVTVVGLVASIVQLINSTTQAIKYLNDVKDAPKERATLAREAASLLALLTDLRYKLEEAKRTDPWFTSIRSLGVENGPLDQFKEVMEELARKLKPEAGIKKFGKSLFWTLDKNDINGVLSKIERLKTLVGLALQKDHFMLSRAIKDDVTEVAQRIGKLQSVQKNQESRDIIAWLSPLNFSAKQNDFLRRRQDGTGEWFLEDDSFKEWLYGTKRTLWCPGLPGAGKTVLTSIIVDYLKRSFEQEKVAVAYTYCSYKEQADQTDVNLVSSLLQQLIQRNYFISGEIWSLYHHHIKTQTRPTIAEWSQLLQLEARHLSKVFIVIDALDECSESSGTRDSFLAEIRKLPNVHLLVTSRYVLTIEREFENAASVEIRASDEDVRRYVQDRIEKERRLMSHVNADPTLQETITNTISKKVKGMFLLAQLHMDSLAKKHNRRDVRIALENLPKELNGTYDEAMQRIYSQDGEDAKLAKQVLCWISYAFRPLTVTEIQHALAVEPGDMKFDEEALTVEDLLVSVCAGLVAIDQESNIIRLVHYTTQEYFERVRGDIFRTAKTEIATNCLTYLSFDEFAKGPCLNDKEMEARLQKNALLDYAARYWGDHARGDAESAIKNLVLEFLMQEPKLSCSIQVTYISQYHHYGYAKRFPKHVPGLLVAASFGLEEITSILLAARADVNATDSYNRTALIAAAENGHLKVVKRLLNAGADVNAFGISRWTALLAAAENGYVEVVERLLAAAADVNAAAGGPNSRTALQAAAGNGHLEVVERLLAAKADVNAAATYGPKGRMALQAAAENGHPKVVERLLAAGANVNDVATYGSGHRTALQAAAKNGHLEVVKRLLEARADVNAAAASSNGRTALQTAAENGHLKVVERLLEAGADINAAARGPDSRTALQAAAEGGHFKVVERLLAAGANVNASAAGYGGWTALQAAAGNGHLEVVEILLAAGANVDTADVYGSRTALQAAAGNGHLNVVERLLAAKADVNAAAASYDSRTALQAAAGNGHLKVVERLLAAEADINAAAAGPLGQTALQAAVKNSHLEIVNRLLEAGADVNAAAADSYDGRTALLAAAENGHLELVERLLGAEADVNATSGPKGWTALQVAAENGHVKVVERLLAGGANVNATYDFGGTRRTALQAAKRNGHLEVVERLLAAVKRE